MGAASPKKSTKFMPVEGSKYMSVTLKPKGNCDFCCGECNADMRGAKAYACRDFPLPGSGNMSYGAWGACPTCAELIDAKQWESLCDRMVEDQLRRFGAMGELMGTQLRLVLGEQIRMFNQNRIAGEQA
jgi:hypothetical protein